MAGGVFTSISKVGELMDDEDSISNIYVKVEKGVDAQEVADRIDAKYGDNITTITSVMEMEQMADMLNMLQASTWAISLLAIIVGGLGIINTMLMSVFERTIWSMHHFCPSNRNRPAVHPKDIYPGVFNSYCGWNHRRTLSGNKSGQASSNRGIEV